MRIVAPLLFFAGGRAYQTLGISMYLCDAYVLFGDLDQDHLDHGASKKPMNPLLSRIHRFV